MPEARHVRQVNERRCFMTLYAAVLRNCTHANVQERCKVRTLTVPHRHAHIDCSIHESPHCSNPDPFPRTHAYRARSVDAEDKHLAVYACLRASMLRCGECDALEQ
jgi:hypothetical protein